MLFLNRKFHANFVKFITITLILTLVAGCGAKTATTGKNKGGQAIPVQTKVVQTGDINSVNTLTGSIIANLTTNVGSKAAGKVVSVNVDMGETVHAGEVLAQLDPSDLQAQITQTQSQLQVDQANIAGAQANINGAQANIGGAQANADQAASDYQREEALYNAGAAAKTDLEAAQLKADTTQSTLQSTESSLETAQSSLKMYEATLNKDQTAVATLQQQLADLTITSPVDGVVGSKNIEVGEMVSTANTLFTIAQLDPLQIAVNVPDQIISEISPGAQAKVSVAQFSKTPFDGQVTKISPVLDSTSHAYPIKIQLANQNGKLLPGMTATVQFPGLKSQPGIIIPVGAVVETPQGSEVFTVQNNVAHMHIVQMGAVSSDQAVINSGLNAGEQLVIAGQEMLSDGSPVTVVQNANQAGVSGMIKKANNQGAKK